jgi:hypothetical protein
MNNENLQSGRGSVLNQQNQFDSSLGIGRGGNLTEQQVRGIVKNEMMRNYRSGSPLVPPHTHNETDNLKINEDNILPGTSFNGSIEFDSVATYTIPIIGTPKCVKFYGAARGDLTGSPAFYAYRAIIIGEANIGSCYQFQPGLTASPLTLTLNNIKTPWIQGCSTLVYDTGLATSLNNVSQTYLAYVAYPTNSVANIKVAMGLIKVSNTEIQLQVATLASGWFLTGLVIVS